MRQWIHKLGSKLIFRLMYIKSPPWDSGISPPELIEFLENHPPGRALDLGCGTGTNVITLRKRGWEVTGIDFIAKAIKQARRKARQAGVDVNLIIGDVSDPQLYEGHYDLILDMGCYHALNEEQRQHYRENVADHLSSAGTYMLYGFLSADGSRITDNDIEAFEQVLKLSKRVDSQDGSGPESAWFWFQPKE